MSSYKDSLPEVEKVSAGMSGPQAEILNSWKEIACYLDRGLRTVQRWHSHLGLPAYRQQGSGRNAVYAFRSELDQWIRSCPTERGRGIFADAHLTDRAASAGRLSRAGVKFAFAFTGTPKLIQEAKVLRRQTQEVREKLRQTIAQLHRTVQMISYQPGNNDAEQLTMRIPVGLSALAAAEKVRANNDVLNSWKEIAAYFGRGVRTVQRWEAEFSLPVRRPHGYTRSAVFAIRAELDAWLKSDHARHLGRNPTAPAEAPKLNPQQVSWLQTQLFIETLTNSREQLRVAISEFQRTLGKLLPPPEGFSDGALRNISQSSSII